ncbi:hypothetical protein PROFUN_13844 [Planoprotostelium fungivorum]|uniref:Uncharacterized protein n=1 Tax=Planoprotostelium fungivorum TaxID=1890364 RepID=A0A2P6N2Q3_9EUKA|nr:hypothetical protein PROFUN_13844 [Planoprotostelium fungivorum]
MGNQLCGEESDSPQTGFEEILLNSKTQQPFGRMRFITYKFLLSTMIHVYNIHMYKPETA